MEDDFVVERASVERMRMADEGGVSGVGGSGIEEGFEASGGAVEEEGADGGGVGGHGGSSLVVRRSSLVLRRSSFGLRYSLFAVRYLFLDVGSSTEL